MAKPRFIVKVTDWSGQEAYIGTFLDHERAQALATRINAGISKGNKGNAAGWASVVLLERVGVREIVEWALGYPK